MNAWEDESLSKLFPTLEQVAPPPIAGPPTWLIDGEVRPWLGPAREVRSCVAVRGGATVEGPVLGSEALVGEREALLAVEAAVRAFDGGEGAWPSASVERRIKAVLDFAEAIESRLYVIADLLMWEVGKPRKAALDEVTRSIDYIRNTVEHSRRIRVADKVVRSGNAGGTTHWARTHRRPLGVVVCVAPYNYPINEFLTTIIPALLMGNVVIAKTPRFGALATSVLFPAFREHFPAGVVGVLTGEGRAVLPALMAASRLDTPGTTSGVVDALAFIGGEAAANALLRAHPAPITLHKVLGLGAKNVAVVLPDADLDRAATAIVKGALGFNGQRCTAEKLVFAQRQVHRPLLDRVVERVSQLKVGAPWETDVSITPLPEPQRLQSMWSLLTDALERGAKVENHGGGRGWHSIMRPAVVSGVTPEMRLYHEEQFGPILPIAMFDDIEEVIEWQRRSPFGQQSAVWGSPTSARSLVRKLMRYVARVNVNDVCQRGPDCFGFTATDKSGFGTLSLEDALLTFSRPVLLQSKDEEALDAFLSTAGS